jgi:hypothetical protein
MITLIVNDQELHFEHSLVSLSDWEAEYEKPFFSPKDDEEKSKDELMRYFELMLIGRRKHIHLVRLLSDEQQLSLANYIAKSRTATTVREIQKSRGPRENITSELIYYWLVAFKIPFKPTDEWHLNRLLMLVKVCGAKSAPPVKQTRRDQAQRVQSMRELNEKRRRELGTKG